MNPRAAFAFVTVCLACASCAPAQPGDGLKNAAPPVNGVYAAGPVKYKVENVVTGVEVPWAIAFAPDGRMLFTERAGRVRSFKDGKLSTLHTFKDVRTGGEIGLMGLCLHPDFAKNHFVYIAYGHQDGNDLDIRVVRMTDKDGVLTDEKVILSGFPAGSNHAGCRIKFGPDGKLYITTGEKFQRQLAQDLNSLGGKVLRVNDDGSAPDDNPFAGKNTKPKVRPEIYSYGNRNPQGIDWQPGSGRLFEAEHGPSGEVGRGVGGKDEFNFIEPGKNYGWPEIYGNLTKPGLEAPLINWDPATAPCAASFYTGDKIPQWKNSCMVAFLGGLGGAKRPGICRITLDGAKVVAQEMLVSDMGRIREVITGPDGYLYFSTSNKDGRGRPGPDDDRICRIVPDGASASRPIQDKPGEPAAAPVSGPLGSKTNPVKCDMPAGERAYLSRLHCPDGSKPHFERRGSVGKGPYGNIMDVYVVTCAGAAPVDIYMDMYFPGHSEAQAIPGFTIDK